MKIDEEFKSLIKPLEDDERKGLEQRLIAEGCRDPIVVWEDTIVDGHNRYEICERNGIQYNTVSIEFDNRTDALVWIIDNQRARRNLPKQAWLDLGFKRAELLKPRAKDNQGTRTDIFQKSEKSVEPVNTVKEAADYAGVSVDTAAKYKRIMSKANDDIRNAVEAQEMSINEAYHRMKHEQRIFENKEQLAEQGYSKATELQEIEGVKAVAMRDENMLKVSSEPSESRLNVGDWVTSLNDTTIYTVTRLSRFFHREDMREFSLREYADVQTFAKDYKFIGTDSEIKSQIGNAVAPKMGEYIARQLKGKTAGDLFAGAGGFTSGLHRHDITCKWAVEWEKHAAQTFKLNNQDARVYNTNIKSLDPGDFENVDIIIGGPPCQGFSTSGNRFKDDPRNEMYKEFIRFVESIRPGEFIMENVAEIMEISDQIIHDFEAIGYEVKTKVVYGPDIGMKQTRKRAFFIGERK